MEEEKERLEDEGEGGEALQGAQEEKEGIKSVGMERRN